MAAHEAAAIPNSSSTLGAGSGILSRVLITSPIEGTPRPEVWWHDEMWPETLSSF
jgi:hypothetical protein